MRHAYVGTIRHLRCRIKTDFCDINFIVLDIYVVWYDIFVILLGQEITHDCVYATTF